MAMRYEYKVEELREGMIGGKMSGGKLEKLLNQHARQGWQVKAVTAVEVGDGHVDDVAEVVGVVVRRRDPGQPVAAVDEHRVGAAHAASAGAAGGGEGAQPARDPDRRAGGAADAGDQRRAGAGGRAGATDGRPASTRDTPCAAAIFRMI